MRRQIRGPASHGAQFEHPKRPLPAAETSLHEQGRSWRFKTNDEKQKQTERHGDREGEQAKRYVDAAFAQRFIHDSEAELEATRIALSRWPHNRDGFVNENAVMKVAVTGASGFVGRALVGHLSKQGHVVTPVVRSPQGLQGERVVADIEALASCGSWGVDAIVHLAARAHVLRETAADPLAEFRKVNSSAAIELARSAAASGVRRFVFMSTIGVNGDHTQAGRPFDPDDAPDPQGPYALSKWEAELGLRDVAARTGLELVIIRPPLVYGAGAKGRFASLVKWLRRGVPLPLGLVRNRRHFVSIDNLTDFVGLCLSHPAAAGETFLIADAESVSTPDLARLLASKMGKHPRLLPMPPALLKAGARLIGQERAARSFLASLEIDLEKNFRLLGWSPPVTLEQGLARAVRAPQGIAW
jgi:nucleoside-diphosphate-sugar epimerase